MVEPIPSPRGLPIIGNLLDLQDPEGVPIQALERMLDIYGPICKFKAGKNETIMVGGQELFEELCDETRFWKAPITILAPSAEGTKGLFAAHSERDENWQKAHRILMPAFGPLAIEQMFDEMNDIATQLMLKWARRGPEHKILAAEDFSRLTLDTIALCGMGYRFNSFYSDEMHPYVQAMNRELTTKSQRNQVSGIIKSMLPGAAAAGERDRKLMDDIGDEIVKIRRENPVETKDLLNAMLHNKDPKTGETMSDALIVANMKTFLIAGHETTSGMLTFAFARMLKNPETYIAAQKEVDEVCGKEKVNVHHLGKLKYINALLKETLRLNPTAPGYFRGARPENKEDPATIGHGKYAMPKGGVLCLLTKIHKDPRIWGADAAEFKPERMLEEKFEKLPQSAWKPFGTGMRSCIGRAFAWQEALLAVALILQNFQITLDDPTYEMKIVQSLTIKPRDFYMHAKLRPGITTTSLLARLGGGAKDVDAANDEQADAGQDAGGAENLKILYGSNTGTCEALARKMVSHASQNGFHAGMATLDSAIEHLPTDMPVAIITASYEGEPCDNAMRFTSWLQSLSGADKLKDVKYAVFGVGHSDWRDTFQRQPKLVDAKLAELGATRIAERGQTDVSKNNLFADFEDWAEKNFWPSLPQPEGDAKRSGAGKHVKATLKMDVKSEDRAAALQQQHLQWGKVLDTKQLTKPGGPQKWHIEIGLPEGTSYQVGDYLAILPLNPDDSVKRVMQKFKLNVENIISISDAGPTSLPTNIPMHVGDLLKGYVELSQPATLRDIETLASKATAEEDKRKLDDIHQSNIYESAILQHRISVLDLLEQYPSIELPFDQFLTMLPPLQTRHYSISSSSLAQPHSCTLTYSVIDAPTLSGLGDRFHGVTGTYMQSLKKGDEVLVSVRATNKLFRLPIDQENIPIMMFCAGSGIAPFRGFVQERAFLIQEGGRKLAPALLFAGCRSKDEDMLYADEFAEWTKIGAVDVRYAFSHGPADSEGCKYVQDRMLHDKEEVADLFRRNAMVYVCGSKEISVELGNAAREIIKWRAEVAGKDVEQEKVEAFMHSMKNSRFVSDVFT